jgi:hypothetical protein
MGHPRPYARLVRGASGVGERHRQQGFSRAQPGQALLGGATSEVVGTGGAVGGGGAGAGHAAAPPRRARRPDRERVVDGLAAAGSEAHDKAHDSRGARRQDPSGQLEHATPTWLASMRELDARRCEAERSDVPGPWVRSPLPQHGLSCPRPSGSAC